MREQEYESESGFQCWYGGLRLTRRSAGQAEGARTLRATDDSPQHYGLYEASRLGGLGFYVPRQGAPELADVLILTIRIGPL